MARWYQHDGEQQGALQGEVQEAAGWAGLQGELRGGRRSGGASTPRTAPRRRPAPSARGTARAAPGGRRRPRWSWLRPRIPWLVAGAPLPWGASPPESAAAPPSPAPAPEPPPAPFGAEPPGDSAEPRAADADAGADADVGADADAGAGADADAGPGSEPERETFTRRFARGAPLALTWSKQACALDRFPLAPATARALRQAGIYLAVETPEPGAPPLYVGESDDVAKRWQGRLRAMYQVGLIDAGRLEIGPARRPLLLWVGALGGGSAARKTVEHAINRTLIISGLGARLRNRSSMRLFEAGDAIAIQNLLPSGLAAKVLPAARARLQLLQRQGQATAAQRRELASVQHLLQAYDGQHLKLTAGMRYELRQD